MTISPVGLALEALVGSEYAGVRWLELAFPDGTAWRWSRARGWVAIGCACESELEDPGPTHLPACPWSDPEYPEGVPF